MSAASLLPTSATELQQALDLVTAKSTALDHNIIRMSHDPLTCDPSLLPWLAWAASIDDAEGWVFAEGETEKRALIANYIRKHELKGTPASIRQLFRDLGLGEIDIIEDVFLSCLCGSEHCTHMECIIAHFLSCLCGSEL